MKIIVDRDRCTGCKTCVRVCPQQVLAVRHKKVEVLDEATCMGCFGCEEECPDKAIRVLKASHLEASIEVEAPPDHGSSCDVVVVGAGPAGLGAAIRCARNGLSVVVCERLPNRSRSHHPDGGIVLTFPGITAIQVIGPFLQFPQLGIRLPRELASKRVSRIGVRGPGGLRMGEEFPPGMTRAIACGKDELVRALITLAESEGAKVRFGTRVDGFLRDRAGRFRGVKLHTNETIEAEVVVCADGVTGKLSQAAGLPNNDGVDGYISLLELEYENTAGLQPSLVYLYGDLAMEQGMPPAMAGFSVGEKVHVMLGFLNPRRFHPTKKPLGHYLRKLIASDSRVRELVGSSLDGQEPQFFNGCRGVFRPTNHDIVRDGLISVGDAFVAGGELGNLPALAAGVHAGKTILAAAYRKDFSADSLKGAASFVTPALSDYTVMHGRMKRLGERVTDEELRILFQIMQHANYPTLMLGTPVQQVKMFSAVMRKSLPTLLRHPGVLRKLM